MDDPAADTNRRWLTDVLLAQDLIVEVEVDVDFDVFWPESGLLGGHVKYAVMGLP